MHAGETIVNSLGMELFHVHTYSSNIEKLRLWTKDMVVYEFLDWSARNQLPEAMNKPELNSNIVQDE